MSNVIYKIYWTENEIAKSKDVSDLIIALKETEELRKQGMKFVTMVSENTEQVGKSGVSSVSDGKLPSGEVYTYTKKDTLSHRTKVPHSSKSSDNIEVPFDDE